MANQEHLDILKQGVDVWNQWRKEVSPIAPHKYTVAQPDLGAADLSHIHLSGVDFSNTLLTYANLSSTALNRANFTYADLNSADLSLANLNYANFTSANLSEANLSNANLIGTVLSLANLNNAKFSQANLTSVNLAGANLTHADLSSANLSGAFLYRATLMGADLSYAEIQGTIFSDVDLSSVVGLGTVKLRGPSSIGIDTIYRSQGKIPERFLRDAGVPDSFLEYMHSLVGKPIRYFTCFISHSHQDQRFCDRLYVDLRHHDVPSWYFPEDATWGKTVWGEIDRSIKIYDKLVVVCSEHSLQSPAVQREIERALQREDREGKNILFPLRLDNYLFQQWEHERKADVVSKVAGDFRGWESSAEKYDKAFKHFLEALQREGTTGA